MQKFVLAGIGLAQVVPPAMPVLGVGKTPEDLNPLVVDLVLYMEQQKWIWVSSDAFNVYYFQK